MRRCRLVRHLVSIKQSRGLQFIGLLTLLSLRLVQSLIGGGSPKAPMTDDGQPDGFVDARGDQVGLVRKIDREPETLGSNNDQASQDGQIGVSAGEAYPRLVWVQIVSTRLN